MKSCYLCCAVSPQFFCPDCEREISWVRHFSSGRQFCLRCGIENFSGAADYCDSCRDLLAARPGFCVTQNYPLAYYRGLFAELLQWYKFSKELQLAKYFVSLLREAWHRQFSGYFVVPVPPRAAKLKQEAWDQVGYLCRRPLPVLQLLQRNAATQQKRLNREQRLTQHRAYSLVLPARRLVWQNYRRLGPLRLLLLDDVYTTGSTMDMCRHALLPLEREGWIAEIRSLSLCLVP